MLADLVMAVAIKIFTPRWDLIEEAHVPLQIDLCIQQFSGWKVPTRGTVKCERESEESEISPEEACDNANKKYEGLLHFHLAEKGP